jgi:DNA-binding NarL/FixJ family response regulator
MTVRLFLVDDHPVFRAGLSALLDSVSDFMVVGTADDGPEAVAALADGAVDADVVLMDLNLPTQSGVEVTARVMYAPHPPAVLVITMVDDDDTVVAAMRAGARGYVLKGAGGDEIVAAVRTVAAGGAVFGAGVAAQILAATAKPTRAASVADGLTQRERDVLALLADGATNVQIARRLELSLKTVQNYVSRILDKLQVADRTQAALRARSAQHDR